MKYNYLLILALFAFQALAQSEEYSSAGIDQLQKMIFSTSCGIPTCHDGSFEPDFRTTESSFNTLVYHPVVKNNSSNSFTYRVVPGRPEASVLYERITNCCYVNQDDRMPFTVGDTLSEEKINLIKLWITNGAPNQYGIKISAPLTQIYFRENYFVRRDDSTNMNSDAYHLDGIYPKPLVIDSSIENLTYVFLINNGDKSSKTTLALFQDKDYSKLIKEFDLLESNSTYTVSISRSYIKPGNPVFLQLKVLRTDGAYYYPNLNTPYYQRLHWSILNLP